MWLISSESALYSEIQRDVVIQTFLPLKRSFMGTQVLGGVVAATLLVSGCTQLKTQESSPPPLKVESIEAEMPEDEKPAIQNAQMTAEQLYDILAAEMLLKRGQPKAAFALMAKVTRSTQDPGLAERTFQLSMTTLDIEAIKEAARMWREISPEEALPWKASYIMAVREDQQADALDYWQAYAERADMTLEQMLVEASIRVTQSAPEKAGLAFLASLKKRYPDEPAAYYAYGAAAEEYNRPQLAIETLQDAAQRYEQKMRSLDSSSDEDSKDERITAEKLYRQIHLLLASAYMNAQQPVQGLKKLKPYLDQHSDDWEMQEKYARLEVKAGQFQAAEQRYQTIVKNDPHAYTSRLSLALIQLERQDYEPAMEHLIALQKVPQLHSTATYYLGVASYELGHDTQAKAYFSQIDTDDYYLDAQLRIAEIDYPEKGLKETLKTIDQLQPKTNQDRIKLYRAQAIFYGKAQQYKKAVDAYDQALALSPNQVDLLLAQSMLLYNLKDFTRYEQSLQKALKLDPNNPDALNALGYFYVERNERLGDAKQLLDKALALAPNRFYILDSRGWLAYQLGHYEEAEQYLEKALALQLDDEVLIHLIQTKWRLGKQKDAVELWEDHNQSFPENTRLQQLLKTLSRPK